MALARKVMSINHPPASMHDTGVNIQSLWINVSWTTFNRLHHASSLSCINAGGQDLNPWSSINQQASYKNNITTYRIQPPKRNFLSFRSSHSLRTWPCFSSRWRGTSCAVLVFALGCLSSPTGPSLIYEQTWLSIHKQSRVEPSKSCT